MSSGTQPSVAVLSNAFAPYRIPFFNALAKRCRLLVAFDVRREAHREWSIDDGEFEFEWLLTRSLTLPGRPGRQEQRVLHVPLNISSVLRRFRPDVVVSGELGARTASAAAYCWAAHRPLTIWWEGTPHTEAEANWLTSLRRRALLGRASRVWANGVESTRYLVSCGYPESRIDTRMTGIDSPRWSAKIDATRLAARPAVRERWGLKGATVLYVGSLTVPKGIVELVSALDLIVAQPDLPPWSLLLVGSGPLTDRLGSWAAAHPDVPVALTGFVQPDQVAQFYAAADVFVMPSLGDCWSLASLEALVAGLPQVASTLNGGTVDLITSSEIGDAVDPRATASLARCLIARIRAAPQRVPDAVRLPAVETWSTTAMAERGTASVLRSMDR